MEAMPLNTTKMEFTNLNKSILSIFEMPDKYYLNYTHLIATKLRNGTAAAMDIYERGLSHSIGNTNEFHAWLSTELEKFFTEFANNFITDNETVTRLQEELHRRISRDCKYQKFKQDLAYHILTELTKFDWLHLPLGGGRILVFKIIIDYISNLY